MAHGGFKDVLKNGGFLAFLCTQFLGAFNDNAYRIIVSLRAVHIVAQADQSGWYDFTITVSADSTWSRRFTGHLEYGAASITGSI